MVGVAILLIACLFITQNNGTFVASSTTHVEDVSQYAQSISLMNHLQGWVREYMTKQKM